jgi:tetratricopeptide (TPR) repeat protein
MTRARNAAAAILFFAAAAAAGNSMRQDPELETAHRAYESSDYAKAVLLLQGIAAKDPRNGEVQLLLTKSYAELQQHDAAVNSAERAVSIDPQNSVYHEWLGRAYGDKAEHAGPFSGLSLAKKTRKEFETAVQLDGKNFSAQQALVEFYCTAPGIVGGGEDKAQPHIRQLAEMDAAEGHYAAGNCRRQKKDFATADEEFRKALESQPKSAELIYDVGDYAVRRGQPERLRAVIEAGERAAPSDPRGKFYAAVALVLTKEKAEEAERLLRTYLKTAPNRSGYPRPATAHVWLGRVLENAGKRDEALAEFETAVKTDPKNKLAQEEWKRARKN